MSTDNLQGIFRQASREPQGRRLSLAYASKWWPTWVGRKSRSSDVNLQSTARTQTPLIIVGLGFLLGSSIVWVKVLTGYMTPTQIASTRLVLAAATMVALLAVRRELRRPCFATVRGAAVLGVFDSAVPYLLMSWGAGRIDAGVGTVLLATMPLFTTVFAVVLAKEEQISPVKIAALLVGFLGVMVIAAPKGLDISNGFEPAHAAFIGGAVTLSASTVYGRALLKEAPALELSAWKLIAASAVVLPIMFLVDGAPDTAALSARPLAAMIFVGVVSTGLARMAYLWASGVIGSSTVSTVTYVMPAAGLTMAWLVLGEQPAPTTIAGLALIFVSIAGVMPATPAVVRARTRHLWPAVRSRRVEQPGAASTLNA